MGRTVRARYRSLHARGPLRLMAHMPARQDAAGSAAGRRGRTSGVWAVRARGLPRRPAVHALIAHMQWPTCLRGKHARQDRPCRACKPAASCRPCANGPHARTAACRAPLAGRGLSYWYAAELRRAPMSHTAVYHDDDFRAISILPISWSAELLSRRNSSRGWELAWYMPEEWCGRGRGRGYGPQTVAEPVRG
jgi:hypothetical protein